MGIRALIIAGVALLCIFEEELLEIHEFSIH